MNYSMIDSLVEVAYTFGGTAAPQVVVQKPVRGMADPTVWHLADIRAEWGDVMTPARARGLGLLLIMAAAKADELNQKVPYGNPPARRE